MEHRIQAQSRHRGPAPGPIGNVDARPALLYPHTAISLDDENDLHPEALPRVRMNRRGPRAPLHGGSVAEVAMPADSSSSPVQPAFQDSVVPHVYADPLPMPLAEMIWCPDRTNSKPLHVVRIPRYASFAGR